MKYLYKVPLTWISLYFLFTTILVYLWIYCPQQLVNVNYFHAEPGFIFFLQNTADPDQPAPYLIRIHNVFISACKYMQFDNW